MISPQAAIIYSMVLSAAADGDLANDEIDTIKTIINGLPVFDGFDSTKFNEIAGACTDLLTEEDGLDAAVEIIRQSLPSSLCATAYALSVDAAPTEGLKRVSFEP